MVQYSSPSLTNSSQLEDLNVGGALLPADAKLRAHCRLWVDHVRR
jgi:hypothetical protein